MEALRRHEEERMLTQRRVEALEEPRCRELLRHASVGHVALSIGALPAIVPVRYRVVGDDLVFESANGVPLMGDDGHVVAFETDEIEVGDGTGWVVQAIGVARRVESEEDESPVYRLHLNVISGTTTSA